MIEDNLKKLGINLPKAPKPVGSYSAYKKSGNLLFVSGQVSFKADGTLIKGKAGFSSVTERNLKTGTISVSPHRDLIISAVKKHLLDSHHISGTRENGYNVKESVRDSYHFYGSNNVFTGALKEALDELSNKIFG